MHSGTLNEERDEQNPNVQLGSRSILQSNCTLVRFLHPQNTLPPKYFMVEGIVIDVMSVWLKALSLILVILLGIKTCLIVESTS